MFLADEAQVCQTRLVVPREVLPRPNVDARLETTHIIRLVWVPVGVAELGMAVVRMISVQILFPVKWRPFIVRIGALTGSP